MPANLRFEGNFPELVKNLFTSDVKVSAEHSEIFKIFGGIVFDGVAFLLLIRLIFLLILRPLLLH